MSLLKKKKKDDHYTIYYKACMSLFYWHTKLINCDKASWLRPTDSGTNCCESKPFIAQKTQTMWMWHKIWDWVRFKASAMWPRIQFQSLIFIFSNHIFYIHYRQTLFGNKRVFRPEQISIIFEIILKTQTDDTMQRNLQLKSPGTI